VTITAGVLQLQITEQGAAAVEKKLKDIDTQAKKLGGTPVKIPVAPGATSLIDRQLSQLGSQVTLFKQGAQAANTRTASLRELGQIENQLRGIIGGTNTSIEQRIGAERQLNQLLGGRKAGTESLTAAIGRNILAYVGFSTAVTAYNAVTGAADRQEIAQMRLGATAKLTGQSLASVTEFANRARDQFKIGAGDAADLTQAFFKMASRAGDVSKAGSLMTAWMDLAAAQGIPLSQVLAAVTNALNGNDDGLNRIGLMDPGAIYAKWGPAVGAVNSELNQQQKALAIVNEVLEQGEKARGSYSTWLESTPGKQQQVNSAMQNAAAIMGGSFKSMREDAYGLGTALSNLIVWADKFFTKWDQGARDFDKKTLNFIDRGVDWLFEAAGKQRPSKVAPAQNTSVDGLGMFGAAVAGQIPKPKPPPTAAEIAAAKAAAEEARIARLLDRTNVGTLGVTDILKRTGDTAGDLVGAPTVGVDKNGKMKGVKGLAIAVDAEWEKLAEKMKSRQAQFESIVGSIASVVGGAFADAFTTAFSGGGNVFEEFGKSLMAGIGNILVQLGSSLLAYGLVIAPLAALLNFTPFGGLGLGAGASIAAGLALTALGAGMGAIGGGGSKGGGGGGSSSGSAKPEQNEFAVAFDPDNKLRKSGPSVMPRASGISGAPMPEGRAPIVFAPTIIGRDDLQTQRQLKYMVEKASGRGITGR
jgi:hypothetical protein